LRAIVIVEEKDSSPVPVPEPKPAKQEKEDVEMEDKPRVQIPKEALVPFANPLADDKQTKKLLRTVKKGMCNSSPKLSAAQFSKLEKL
jgi:hypothetical protein